MAFPPAQKQDRRCWLRFRLRTLLGLLTVFGIWLGTTVNGVVNMRRAAGFVLDLGGEVYYHHEPSSGERWKIQRQNAHRKFQGLPPIVPATDPPGPALLHAVVGVDYFRNVSEVQLSKSNVTDQDLGRLRPFRRLKVLSLANRNITDTGLGLLPVFPQLKTLRIQGTQITDDGLGHLAKFTSLEQLDLRGTAVTAAAIEELQEHLPGTEIIQNRK